MKNMNLSKNRTLKALFVIGLGGSTLFSSIQLQAKDDSGVELEMPGFSIVQSRSSRETKQGDGTTATTVKTHEGGYDVHTFNALTVRYFNSDIVFAMQAGLASLRLDFSLKLSKSMDVGVYTGVNYESKKEGKTVEQGDTKTVTDSDLTADTKNLMFGFQGTFYSKLSKRSNLEFFFNLGQTNESGLAAGALVKERTTDLGFGGFFVTQLGKRVFYMGGLNYAYSQLVNGTQMSAEPNGLDTNYESGFEETLALIPLQLRAVL